MRSTHFFFSSIEAKKIQSKFLNLRTGVFAEEKYISCTMSRSLNNLVASSLRADHLHELFRPLALRDMLLKGFVGK